MPQYIIKLSDGERDYYQMWSTIVDAPVSEYGIELESFKSWYIEKYGTSSTRELDERLLRVEETGCSGYPPFDKLDDLISGNRAGHNETTVSKESLIKNHTYYHEHHAKYRKK